MARKIAPQGAADSVDPDEHDSTDETKSNNPSLVSNYLEYLTIESWLVNHVNLVVLLLLHDEGMLRVRFHW